MTTSTVPPETAAEQTREFTAAERAALGDQLAAAEHECDTHCPEYQPGMTLASIAGIGG